MLSSLDIIELISEDGENTGRSRAIHLHLLEHRRQLCETTLGTHSCQELEQGSVGILLQCIGELLNIESCNLCKLCGVLEHFCQEVLYCSSSRFVLLHILVEDRGETHNLRLRESSLLAYTCHSCSEVNEIAS